MERQYNLKSIDFQSLPDDVLYSIVLYMNPKDILELCKSNKIFNNKICRTDFYGIWTALYKKDIDSKVPPNPKEDYVIIMSTIKGLPESESIEFAAENGYHILLDDMLKRTTQEKIYMYNSAMAGAAKGGHIDIIDDMIARGATDWDWAMAGAAKVGYMDIIENMIARGATDWDWAMADAAEGGHIDIIDDMIARGATDWDWAMEGAAKGGHIDIIDDMIQRGANYWNNAMVGAARGGNIDIVEYMVQRGATNWDSAMVYAKTDKIKAEILKLKQKYRKR